MAVDAPPIIIKKIKKRGHGHHGGAWKVALADFVTAMMAFFMLMWLLGSTTPEQKAAIANYMSNPLAEDGPGGAAANIVLEGGDGILEGSGPSAFPQFAPSEFDVDAAEEIAAAAEAERMQNLKEELEAAIEANEALAPFKEQLLLDITSEGLRVQIVDKENRAMFAQGSPVLENYMREILREVGKVINQVPNRISISGHTDQTPYASDNGYSNWELSSDRANAARRELVSGGVPEEKISRVVGLASSVLFDRENPFGPINRRISIIVMNKAAEDAVNSGEGRAAPEAAPESEAGGPPATGTAPAAGARAAAAIDATPLGDNGVPAGALPPPARPPVMTATPPELPAVVTAETTANALPPPLPAAVSGAPAMPAPPLLPANPPTTPAAPDAMPPAPTAPAVTRGVPGAPPSTPAPATRPKKIVKIAIGS